jgi:hypothetical protein
MGCRYRCQLPELVRHTCDVADGLCNCPVSLSASQCDVKVGQGERRYQRVEIDTERWVVTSYFRYQLLHAITARELRVRGKKKPYLYPNPNPNPVSERMIAHTVSSS